ncbi:MAG: SurA N-terminal domain-containing protein, partial [Thermomicrobiaceae bacterium]|nr:SurA N-terminal domain-containing protein [Thermomicrobiaceae bacterium]
MIDRVRQRFGFSRSAASARRRVSRREREEFRRRMVILGVSLAGVLLVLILAGGALYQYVYLPNQALVTVDGTKISRGDYWKVRKLELLNQIAQYSQFAQFASGQQATSYQQLADQARQQLNTVESDPVDTSTLSQMVDDQVLLHHMGDAGVTVTDADIDQFVAEAFAPAPIASPPPTLGVDPTAAAWATAT